MQQIIQHSAAPHEATCTHINELPKPRAVSIIIVKIIDLVTVFFPMRFGSQMHLHIGESIAAAPSTTVSAAHDACERGPWPLKGAT